MDVDGLIFDLEDSVDTLHKETARANLADFLPKRRPKTANTYIRINDISTSFYAEDLKLVFDLKPDALMIPKISTVEEIREIESAVEKIREGYRKRASALFND